MSSKSIVALPTYTFRLRLSQFIITVFVLILNIISTAIYGGYGALGYGIFTPIATCVIVGYWYYATYHNPQCYNRWAILVLDCFSVVWWLSLWSVLASWAAFLGLIDSLDSADGFNDLGSLHTVHALTAIAAVLGAVEFVLFLVSLISYSINLHRARMTERANTHQNPFTNLNYETGDVSSTTPQNYRSKGGVEVSG